MIMISERYFDLAKGYTKARELEKILSDNFTDALTRFIESAEEEYRKQIQQWNEESEEVKTALLLQIKRKKRVRNLSGVFALVMLLLFPLFCVLTLLVLAWLKGSNWLQDSALGPVWFGSMMLLGLLIGGAVLLFVINYSEVRFLEKRGAVLPQKPRHFWEVLGEDPRDWIRLEEQWIRKIGDDSGFVVQDAGYEGEDRLSECLANLLPNEYIGIRRVLVRRSLDIDVLLIGPTGIWILESKYINGIITVENGVWKRYKEYYLPGGFPTQKIDVFAPFDMQWLEEKEAVESIVTKYLPSKLSRRLLDVPEIIKGGVVLTHPKARFLGASSKVLVGDIYFWCDQIANSPPLISFSKRELFQIADAFINVFAQKQNRISSVDLAVALFEHNKRKLDSLLAQELA